jgi:hypothetical protein
MKSAILILYSVSGLAVRRVAVVTQIVLRGTSATLASVSLMVLKVAAALLARSHVTQPMAPLPVIQNPMIVVARLAQSATLPTQWYVKTRMAT